MKYLNAFFGIIAILVCANVSAAPIDVSGTYTAEISYSKQTPMADRRFFFGANPEIELTLTQKGDKIRGKISGDRDGDFKGKIDDEEITFEFYLEVRGSEIKDGAGTWIVAEDGTIAATSRFEIHKEVLLEGIGF